MRYTGARGGVSSAPQNRALIRRGEKKEDNLSLSLDVGERRKHILPGDRVSLPLSQYFHFRNFRCI